MSRWARVLWRWSWLPSLGVLAACLAFLAAVERRFDTFGIRRSIEPFDHGLAHFGRELQDRALHRLRLAVAGGTPGEEFEEVGLEVAAGDLERLDADLPYSGRDAVPGRFLIDGRTIAATLRHRGDTYAHWGRAKKSFRVEVRKKDAVAGRRHFLLIAPKFDEQLNNHLAYVLAQRLGVLAPRSRLVRLRLNGDYRGLYELVERIDEAMLRGNDRMPGDVYRGEVLFETAWSGLPQDLFTRAGLWDKVAVDNRRPAEAQAPLCALLRALHEPASAASHERVTALLDLEQMARLSAFEVLAQVHHDDHFHNWRLYQDPWRGRFEPIVWDPVGWQENTRPQDGAPVDLHPVYTPLHLALHRSAAFLARRQEILASWLRDGGSHAFVAAAQDLVRRVRRPLACDPDVDPVDAARRERALDALAGFVARVAADVEQYVLQDPLRCRFTVPGPGRLRVSLRSERVARSLRVRFDGPVAPSIIAVRAPDGVAVELGDGWRVEGTDVAIAIALPSALEPQLRWRPGSHDLRNVGMVPVRTRYELAFTGTGDRTVVAVTVDGEPATAGDATDDGAGETAGDDAKRAIPGGDVLFGASELWPARRATRTFAGRVAVTGVERVHETVAIAPGTVFAMAPGASLIFTSEVTGLGTAAQPIQVEPANGEPWGTVVLDGPGCTGSRLEHWRFRGGSTLVEPLVRYGAMLSVHAARDVTLRDCTFADPRGPDDVVHLVRSEVRLERLELLASNGDGIDVDLCDVVVRDCRVGECAGDGLDLMGSRALVDATTLLRCKDKGLSIGEGSVAVVVRSTIAGCGTGAAVKEASVAHLLHCRLGHCGTALVAAQEDWRYAGAGAVHVHRSELDHPVLLAAPGTIHLHDCRCDVAAAANVRVEGCSDRPGVASDAVPLPPGLGRLAEVAAATWAAQGPVRGPGGGR